MLANYSELQTAIADHLHRDDLVSIIPTFIKLFESRVNRNLRLSQQETIASLTLTGGSDTVTLPTDNLEVISASLVYPDGYIAELLPLNAKTFDAGQSFTGVPRYYNIRSGALLVDALADQAYTVRIRYLKRWDLATDLTNWLLTYCPDAYLYGSLAAASAYIDDDARLPLWQSLAVDAVSEANTLDNRLRNQPTLRTELSAGGFNIVTGQ